MHSLQETFDYVVNFLRKQGKKAITSNIKGTVCMYKTPDGLKCAAGCLIPDDKYDPAIENRAVLHKCTIVDLFSDRFMSTSHLSPAGLIILEEGHDVNLVSELQGVHDSDINDWEQNFKSVADMYNLVFTPKGDND